MRGGVNAPPASAVNRIGAPHWAVPFRLPFMPSLFLRVFPLCLLLLSACATTRYEYVPPSTEAGMQCIARCNTQRETCVVDEQQRAMFERDACERRNWWNYRFCMMGAFSRRDAWFCENNLRTCWTYDYSWRCEGSYRQCYSACGGRVIKITE